MGNMMQRRLRACPAALRDGALVLAVLFSCFAGLLLGDTHLSAGEAAGALLQGSFAGGPAAPSDISDGSDIIWNLRLPRMLLSLSAGMGLALSGVVMQALFRNPMSSPYIMGISSGASLGVVLAAFLGAGMSAWGTAAMGFGAFAGSFLLSLAILAAAGRRSGDPSYLLILGVAMSAVCSGVTGVLIYCGAASSGTDVSMYWLMGSVASARLIPSLLLLLVVVAFGGFFLTQARILNLMLLGREAALPLGWDFQPFFKGYLVLNAILVGLIVMEAGLIGFVGLIVPHFVRLLLGPDHKRVVPAAIILGGLLTVWADILGRVLLHGVEIPMGVMLAVIGAPLFLFLLAETTGKKGGSR